jgi:UDP-glucuronate 4-epimerase
MAMYIFASKILAGEPIPVFNHGRMQRDFTYINDIIKGVRAAMEKKYSCEVFNLGNNRSEDLLEVIQIIEENIGKKAEMDMQGMQPGDVEKTFADIEYSREMLGYQPTTPISAGIPKFIDWFREYNK